MLLCIAAAVGYLILLPLDYLWYQALGNWRHKKARMRRLRALSGLLVLRYSFAPVEGYARLARAGYAFRCFSSFHDHRESRLLSGRRRQPARHR